MARDTHYDLFKKEKSSTFKTFRRRIEFIVLKTMQAFLYLFPIRWNQKMGAAFGSLIMKLAKKDKGIAKYQLDFCFPEIKESEREKILRNTFRNVGTTLFEALVIKKFKKNVEKWIHFENESIVHELLDQGNGLVLLFGHVGNWEFYPTIYDMLGVEGVAVSSKIGDSKLDDFLLATRESTKCRMLHRGDRKSAKEILKCFRNNEMILIAIDQDTRIKALFVDFFGRKAATAIGPATIAHKFDAPVVSGYGCRREDGTHLFRFEALSTKPYQGTEEEIEQLTNKYSQSLENHIRMYPDQWVWFHRRWKNQPEG